MAAAAQVSVGVVGGRSNPEQLGWGRQLRIPPPPPPPPPPSPSKVADLDGANTLAAGLRLGLEQIQWEEDDGGEESTAAT